MSTFHACWSFKADNVDSILEQMLLASDYWQPDKLSRWCSVSGNIGLAKAQLYNTANGIGDHVRYEKNKGLAITANARIDNRDDLLQQLAIDDDDGSVIDTHGDQKATVTEGQLILMCYEQWGKECVARLRGDFAFVIWDENQQKFFCARDHFGIKTLFYSLTPSGLMVSNEHNSFFTSGWAAKHDVDEKWIVENTWGLCSEAFASPNPNIDVLPPAHILELDHSGLTLTRYWQLESKKHWHALSDDDLIAELKVRFDRAVTTRIDSEYPLGAELSEGLDSNGIVGVAAKNLKKRPLFTFSFLCAKLSKENTQVWADTYTDIEAMLQMHKNVQAVWSEGEGETDSYGGQHMSKSVLIRKHRPRFYQCFGGVLPTRSNNFLRSSLASTKGIRVLLSGLGGDHCVTSYGDNYADELFSQRKIYRLYQLYKAQYQRGRGRHPLRNMLKLTIKRSMPTLFLAVQKLSAGGLGGGRAKHHFLSAEWRNKFDLDAHHDDLYLKLQSGTIKQKEQFELFDLGLNRRVVESELMGRMARVEYRFPMLDVDLVEFAHSLPSHLKISQGIERYAFRKVLDGVTTKRIQWRRKADVAHPKLQAQVEMARYHHYLLGRIGDRRLLKRFSDEQKLRQSLQRNDKLLFECLEFLCDVEDYYFPEADQRKHTPTLTSNTSICA